MKIPLNAKLPAVAVTSALTLAFSATSDASLIITGVIDGDLPGGLPKAIVLTATSDIADLSTFGVGAANNGGGTDGQEATFSGSITTGGVIVVVDSATSSDFFTNNFSDPFTVFESGGSTGAASINGDDAVELFSGGLVIDTYGDINVDGSGQFWEYADGFAVRTGGVAGAFIEGNYAYSNGALDTLDETQQATAIAGAFGFTQVPEPSIALLGGLGLLGILRRRR